MENSIYREIRLSEEIRAASRLIELGLGEIQNLGGANDFYHLPLQLLASGIERLMKCHICYGYLEQHEELPDFKHLRKFGHDLLKLRAEILKSYFQSPVPALKDDFKFLTTNAHLDTLLDLLSEFGKFARYHNLDIVTGADKPSRNVEAEWRILESNIAEEHPEILKKLGDIKTASEACDFIDKQIIILLEKFVRSLCRQFTMGNLGQKAKQHSPIVSSFILLNDDKLGQRNYRLETSTYQIKKRSPKKRSFIDNWKRKRNPEYVSKTVTRSDYEGEWPFYADDVVIECRHGHWCVVTIEGIDYALNGSAQGRYKLEGVHDAGMAILGNSIGDFITMALDLWKERK